MKKLNNRLISLIIAICCLLTSLPAYAITVPIIKEPEISLSSVSGKAGNEVTVDLTITDNPGIAYLKLKVDYDTDLSVVKAENKGVLAGTFTTSKTTSVKPYVLQWMGADDSSSNGVIATVTFKIAENAIVGEKPITVTVEECYNSDFDDVEIGVINGSVTVEAQGETPEQPFTYEINDGKVTITGYNSELSGELVIPSNIEGNPVISIGYFAFSDCEKISSVSIPISVSNIGFRAFANCINLTNITIPYSVSYIGQEAFVNTAIYNTQTNWKNGGLYINDILIAVKFDSLNSYSIMEGTRMIASAFGTQLNDNLKSISIPSSVKIIVDGAFSVLSGLENISVNENNTVYHSVNNCLVETESKTLVRGCKNSVIPNDGSVTTIGTDAFNNISGLFNMTIPDSIIEIQDYAFFGCNNLRNITIPYSVKSIGNYVFWDCYNIESITVDINNSDYFSSDNCLISAEKTLLYGCKNSIIPADGSVTSIGEAAFIGCIELTSIIIPESVTSIGSHAFEYCAGLASITLPISLTQIDEGAFGDCENLANVYYAGTEQQQDQIKVYNEEWASNDYLLNAIWHYNYVPDAECTHSQTKIRNAQFATCCENGYTGDTYCLDCDAKIATGSVIPATGNHADADGKWETDGTQHWHTCYYGTQFDVAAHTGGTATCTEKAQCSVCGVEYGNFARHKLTYHAQVAADYENDGNIEYWTCDECGKYFSDSEGKTEITEDDVIIPKLVINEYKFIDNEVVIEASSDAIPEGTVFDVQKIVPPPEEVVEKVKDQLGASSTVVAYYEVCLYDADGTLIVHLSSEITIKTKMPEQYVGNKRVKILQEDETGKLITMTTWWEGEYICYKTDWLENYN